MTLSICSGSAPSSSISSISVTNGARLRLAAKPSHEPATALILPMSRPIFMAPAIVSIEVFVPLTTSHSFMTFAGAKKCAPPTSCGRFVTLGHDVDVDRGRIREQQRARLHHGVELREHVLLHVDALEHGLDHDIAVADVVVALHRLDERQPLVHLALA